MESGKLISKVQDLMLLHYRLSLKYLILTLTFTFLAFGINTSAQDKKANSFEIVNADKNYKFMLAENSPYQKMLFHTLVNEEADFVLVNSKENIHFALISEMQGKDMAVSQDEFLEEVKSDFTFLNTGVKITEEVSSEVDRITGHRISLIKSESGVNFIYDVRAVNINGMYYKLITYCWEEKGFKKLKEEADYLAQKFKIIDKEKEYYSDNVKILEQFDSSLTPLQLKFEGKKLWFEWDEFESDCPESEFAGYTVNLNQRFCITSFLYDSSKHNDEAIVNTFLRDFNFKLSDEIFSIVKKIDGKPYRSYRLKCTRESDGDQYDYYFEIYFAKDCAILVSLWGDSNTQETKLAYETLMKAVKFNTAKKAVKLENLTAEQKITQRILSNSLGLVYYRQEEFDKAADSFLTAFNFDKEFTNAATNYFWSMSRNNKLKEILQLIEQEPHLLKNPEALAWKAFCLKDAQRFPEAIKAYEQLFNVEEHDDEQDFVEYASLLINDNQREKLNSAIKKFFSVERAQTAYHTVSKVLLDNEALDEAALVIKKLPKEFKETIETKRHLLTFHIANGNYKKAEALFDKLLKDGHRDRQTLYTGAQLYYDIGWYHKSKKVLSELLKVSPNDSEAKELFDLTLGYLGEGNKGNTVEPIQPVALPEELKKLSANIQLSEKESDIHYEYLITSYSFKNNRLKKTVYRKLKLKTSTGVKNNSTFYYNFNPNSSSIYVNQLSVLEPAGKKLVHSDRNAFYLKDSDDDLATEDKTLCMPVSSLQPGCTVEYVITQEFGANYTDFPYEREWLCMGVPYEFLALSVSGDVNKVAYELINSDLKVKKTENELIFNSTDRIVYQSESNDAPPEYNYPLLILGSKGLTWEKELGDYIKKIQSKLVPSDKLEELTLSICKDKESKEDKIQALISYIQKNITYQGIEFGSRGTIPDTPLKVLNQKYGDCKDMAVLLHQMLKVLNIESTLTLASTENKINTDIASLDQFNHMILYIDAIDKFVDCTVKNANLLTIGNTYMHGSKVLLVKSKADFKVIPYYEVTTKAVSIKRKMTLLEDDSIQASEKAVFTGYYAYFLRNNLLGTDQKDRTDKIKDWINYYPEIEDFSVEIVNLDNYMKALELKMKYKIKRAVKTLENEKVFNLETPWLHFYISPEKIKDRKNPVKNYYDFSMAAEIEFDTAGLASISASSPDIKTGSAFFEGKVSAQISKNQLLINSECLKKKGTYPAKDYEDYYEAAKAFLNKAAIHIKLLPVTE